MKSLTELINRAEPGWSTVKDWIATATNHVEVLPPIDDRTRELALLETQVTTRSPMGAVIYETGGILVDHGWLRILGSGHPRLPRSLPNWNRPRTSRAPGVPPPFLLIADDIVGGFFAIDGGGLHAAPGKVCYCAPDSLRWENTNRGYSDFLVFCFKGNLNQYYESLRWPGWQEELKSLPGDKVMSIYPPLWTKGPSISERHRGPTSISEFYRLMVDKDAPL